MSHSLGGLYAQYLIRKYPQDFVGAVFIDTRGADYRGTADNQKAELEQYVNEAKTHNARYMYDEYSPAIATKVPEKHIVADAAYVVLAIDINAQQIMAYPKIPNIPIFVLYSTYMEKTMPDWMKGQPSIANQSNKSQLVKVSGSHYIYQDDPKLVCQYIKEVINEVDASKNTKSDDSRQ